MCMLLTDKGVAPNEACAHDRAEAACSRLAQAGRVVRGLAAGRDRARGPHTRPPACARPAAARAPGHRAPVLAGWRTHRARRPRRAAQAPQVLLLGGGGEAGTAYYVVDAHAGRLASQGRLDMHVAQVRAQLPTRHVGLALLVSGVQVLRWLQAGEQLALLRKCRAEHRAPAARPRQGLSEPCVPSRAQVTELPAPLHEGRAEQRVYLRLGPARVCLSPAYPRRSWSCRHRCTRAAPNSACTCCSARPARAGSRRRRGCCRTRRPRARTSRRTPSDRCASGAPTPRQARPRPSGHARGRTGWQLIVQIDRQYKQTCPYDPSR